MSNIDLLLEKFLTAVKHYSFGKHEQYEIFVNPTRREMKEFGVTFRFIIDLERGNLYIFDENFMHQDAWNQHIAPFIKTNRKMYHDASLFGGVVWKGQVRNEGLDDGLYRVDILEEWLDRQNEFNKFQKYLDIKDWFDRWGGYMESAVRRGYIS